MTPGLSVDTASRTRADLRRAMYHTERAGTPDARLAAVRRVLGRDDLRHGDLDRLSEADARAAIAALDEEFGIRRRGVPRGTSRRRRFPR